ncbi:hypothetical protein [Streptomyces sp. NPDC048527]|uniref:hypothetical protein n=1 Tax=Streptomyces sp. NPDC048527 TaxID=3365568 RepID=UPI003711F9EC
MGCPDGTRNDAAHNHEAPPAEVTYDSRWAGDLRSAIRCSAVILGVILLIDWASGGVTAPRATLWTALAVLLFLVLYPARVSAGEGWLASRGLLRERRVRTDASVSVRCLDGVSQRLRLRDTSGRRIEINPQVLVNSDEAPDQLQHPTGLTDHIVVVGLGKRSSMGECGSRCSAAISAPCSSRREGSTTVTASPHTASSSTASRRASPSSPQITMCWERCPSSVWRWRVDVTSD